MSMKLRAATKKLEANVKVPPAPVGVPSQWSLVLVSHQSGLSANDKRIMK